MPILVFVNCLASPVGCMSRHYEWTLSLRFRVEVPEAFLEELGADFGIGPGAAPDGDGSELPGGPVANLVRQQLTASTWLWGLCVRTMVLDDAMYELMLTVPPRLARWSGRPLRAGPASRGRN